MMEVDAATRTSTWAAPVKRGQADRREDAGRADNHTERAGHAGHGRGLFGEAARPLRFALTGGIAGATQLALLALLTRHGWQELPANGVAFLLAAQVNFALSATFTWRDRFDDRALGRRWLTFHGSIAIMAVINMLVFAFARLALPALAASALGIGVAAVGNFVVGDHLVFRRPTSASRTAPEEETAA